jgi:hypothetical protein
MKDRLIVTTVIAKNIHLIHVLYPRKHSDSTLQKLQSELISFFNISRTNLFELLSFQA